MNSQPVCPETKNTIRGHSSLFIDVLNFLIRRETVKLRLSNRFFHKLGKSGSIKALHRIDNLHIELKHKNSQSQWRPDLLEFFTVNHDSNKEKFVFREFAPAHYVRFRSVGVHTLIFNNYWLDLLQKYKNSFIASALFVIPSEVIDGFEDTTIKLMFQNVFLNCSLINIYIVWDAHNLSFCSLSGISNCNNVSIISKYGTKDCNNPFIASVFQWLHEKSAKYERNITLESLLCLDFGFLDTLINKFKDDMKPHSYSIKLYKCKKALEQFVLQNRRTGEQMSLSKDENRNDTYYLVRRAISN